MAKRSPDDPTPPRKDYDRIRALKALGGVCAWCPRTDHLQIDHTLSDGGAHRKALGTTTIERWMCREKHRTGFWPWWRLQLLCPVHHVTKTTLDILEKTPMPPRAGCKSFPHMSIPEDIITRLRFLATAAPYGNNLSALCEDIFEQYIAAQLTEDAVHGLQHQFSKTAALIGQDIHALAGVVQTLTAKVEALTTQLVGLAHIVTSLKTAQTQMEGLMETQRRDLLDAIRRRTTGTPDPAPSSHTNGQAPKEKESFWRTHTGRRS